MIFQNFPNTLENFEISLAVLLPNTTTSHAITYTNIICLTSKSFVKGNRKILFKILHVVHTTVIGAVQQNYQWLSKKLHFYSP